MFPHPYRAPHLRVRLPPFSPLQFPLYTDLRLLTVPFVEARCEYPVKKSTLYAEAAVFRSPFVTAVLDPGVFEIHSAISQEE